MNRIFSKFIRIFGRKKNNKIELKEIREYLPNNFLHFVLDKIIKNDSAVVKCDNNWKVVNCYFCGLTLCLDIKNEKHNIEDVITVCSNNTFGSFKYSKSCKRSNLTNEEINLLNKIRANYL